MATAMLMSPGPVEVPIGYLHRDTKNPELHVGTASAQLYAANLDRINTTIKDLRKSDFKPDLHRNGFSVVDGLPLVPIALRDGDEQIKKDVYDQVKAAVKERTGAAYVHIFSHIVRVDAFDKVLDELKKQDPMAKSPYQTTAQFAHVDQSYNGALLSLERTIDREPADIAAALQARKNSRWAIINLWQPISPIRREPLACTNGRSVPDADLRTLRAVTKAMVPGGPDSELWQAVHQPQHDWYWQSNMMPGEGFLIKCFDTKIDREEDGVCRRALHSAFQHPEDAGDEGRKSCEFRCFVFWDDQPLSEEEQAHAFDNTYATS